MRFSLEPGVLQNVNIFFAVTPLNIDRFSRLFVVSVDVSCLGLFFFFCSGGRRRTCVCMDCVERVTILGDHMTEF